MRKPIKIGSKEFKFKKDAIAHYRQILNSYDFFQSLNDIDYNDLLDLLDYVDENNLQDSSEIERQIIQSELIFENIENSEFEIIDIKIAKVQFNTKCFELIYSDNTTQYISYLMMIRNTKYKPENLFNIACRNAIHDDIRKVKQEYFDVNSAKGMVKCQETGILSKWTELVVDHRQPNTFSIIVDRFKEVNNFDMNAIEFDSNDKNHIIFEDGLISFNFKEYHKSKASLRIVRTECNSSRTGLARIKRSSKDFTIK